MDNDAVQEAFRRRAMQNSPVPVPGMTVNAPSGSPQTLGGMPSGGQPSPIPTGGQVAQSSDEVGILKQVAGKITENEMIETLIKRLKDLMAEKEKPQGGAANVGT